MLGRGVISGWTISGFIHHRIPAPAQPFWPDWEQRDQDWTPWTRTKHAFVPELISYTTEQVGTYRILLDAATEQDGLFRVNNDIAAYLVYIGLGTAPDLEGTPDDSFTALPFTHVLTPPVSGTQTYVVVVRTRDTYGLLSAGQLRTSVTLDSAGRLVLPGIGAPERFGAFTNQPLSIRVLATYAGLGIDQYPADLWNVWVGTELPTPGTTVPTRTQSVEGSILTMMLTGLSPGTYLVSAALSRSGDGTWSPVVHTSVIVVDVPLVVRAVPGEAAR